MSYLFKLNGIRIIAFIIKRYTSFFSLNLNNLLESKIPRCNHFLFSEGEIVTQVYLMGPVCIVIQLRSGVIIRVPESKLRRDLEGGKAREGVLGSV